MAQNIAFPQTEQPSNQGTRIEAGKAYVLTGEVILAILNTVKDELPARYANQSFQVERLLAHARELPPPPSDDPEEQ